MRGLWQSLIEGTTPSGNIDAQRVNKFGIMQELKKFKLPTGGINYPALFEIPVEDRIPAMAKKDLAGTIKAITVALTVALETMNLSRPMNAIQILDLAEVIVDDADNGDNISLEDLLLFLQKLTRGEYPDLYEGFDQVKFMSRFNQYRDQRWEIAGTMKYNQHLSLKGLGPAREGKPTELGELMADYTNKIGAMKDEIMEKKAENNRLRDFNNFLKGDD